MIKRFHVENYKALRDVSLELTPIHVLIGPNNSGKTSIMEALAAMCRSVDYDLSKAFMGSWKGPELVWKGDFRLIVLFAMDIEENKTRIEYYVKMMFPPSSRDIFLEEEEVYISGNKVAMLNGN